MGLETLSSQTAISSPHLFCFQSPTHVLPQLYRKFIDPDHDGDCFQALLPPNSQRTLRLRLNNGSGDILRLAQQPQPGDRKGTYCTTHEMHSKRLF